ncbi:hypothetical protein AYI69_g8398 [Smittium culicis]|uniref:Uncharacterized protein n=1 Tax=Smittium culicis TaxID=133412 RepID=A0A1R1XJU1_9FUNG|nr:hypothetical protein AYI69_g8398 [Smittium culicis]
MRNLKFQPEIAYLNFDRSLRKTDQIFQPVVKDPFQAFGPVSNIPKIYPSYLILSFNIPRKKSTLETIGTEFEESERRMMAIFDSTRRRMRDDIKLSRVSTAIIRARLGVNTLTLEQQFEVERLFSVDWE